MTYQIHAKAQSLPRTPTYDGKTTAEWSPPSLSQYVKAFGTDEDSDATQVSQLSQSSKSSIAARTLMGNANSSTVDGLISYPVVTPDDNLSSQALRSVHQLAHNSSKEAALQRMSERLLDDEFDIQIGDREEDEEDAEGSETDQTEAASGIIASAETVSADGLTGVIWSTGSHSLELGGKATRVYVPADTIKPTYEELKERIGSGEATIGFDHVEGNSVAANTSLGEIGRMKSVRLSEDGESIVLTESEVTSNKAQEALASGQFDGYDFSFVGTILPEVTTNGKPVLENGAVKVAATHIKQVDVVSNGAVSNAQIGRIPALASDVRTQIGHEVAESPSNRIGSTLALIGHVRQLKHKHE